MIDYKNELLITKEVINVLKKFTKAIIIKDLLYSFSFESSSISHLLIDSNKKYSNMHSPGSTNDDAIWNFVTDFLSKLSKDSIRALQIHVLDESYEFIEDEFTNTDDFVNEKNLNKEFGRFLAGKIYDPKNTELEHQVTDFLKALLMNFSTEFDFSLLDEQTHESVKDTINNYTSIVL